MSWGDCCKVGGQLSVGSGIKDLLGSSSCLMFFSPSLPAEPSRSKLNI
jgi:hypothetical protein